jgi:penicillin amidase
MQTELAHYHPRGAAIIQSFVDGINAYIAETERDPAKLRSSSACSTQARSLDHRCRVSRHAGLLGNITDELTTTRAVAAVGPQLVKQIENYHPGDPDLTLDAKLDKSLLSAPILALYQAFRAPLRFQSTDVAPAVRASRETSLNLIRVADSAYDD